MDKEILLQVIRDQREMPKKQNTVKRDKLREIERHKNTGQIVVISGLRRCGKSTLLEQIRRSEKLSDYYLNFDDDRLIEFKVSDFQLLLEVFIEQFKEQDIFYFDEIQNIKGWERFVRRLYEKGKKVYVTGSNASMLSKELGTHLTGRYVQVELYPFSFKEFLEFNKVSHTLRAGLSSSERSEIKRQFLRYSEVGGIPEYVKTGQQDYIKMLFDNIIYRDIFARYGVSNEKQFKELVYFIASNIGKDISFNSLKNMLGLGSANTVREYLYYLENSYLIYLVTKYERSVKKQLYGNKKTYMIDNALAKLVGFRYDDEKGRMLENTVFLELKRRGLEVYFYRDKRECDFLIKKGNKITEAIQVCFVMHDEQTRKRETEGLIDALKEFNLHTGMILTNDEESTLSIKQDKTYKIQIKPVWKWLIGY
jgi:predicted AAA+ superfamily ATPase